jgi:hypothetical protein
VAELAQASLGDLLRGVGKVFIETVMEAEVEQLAGKRSQPNPRRNIYRWGIKDGYCMIDRPYCGRGVPRGSCWRMCTESRSFSRQ